jgi:hypothetical protein
MPIRSAVHSTLRTLLDDAPQNPQLFHVWLLRRAGALMASLPQIFAALVVACNRW